MPPSFQNLVVSIRKSVFVSSSSRVFIVTLSSHLFFSSVWLGAYDPILCSDKQFCESTHCDVTKGLDPLGPLQYLQSGGASILSGHPAVTLFFSHLAPWEV